MNKRKSDINCEIEDAKENLDFARINTSDGYKVREATRNLGVAYIKSGDLVRARELLASVVSAETNDPETWSYITADAAHRLGHVLNRLGEFEEARHIQELLLDYNRYDGGDGSIVGLYYLIYTINALGDYADLHHLGDSIIDARLRQKERDSRKIIRYLASIAHMWVFIGDYDRAAKVYRRIIPQQLYKLSSPLTIIKSLGIFFLFVPAGKLLMRLDDNFDPSRRWRRELAKRQHSSGSRT